MKSQKLINSDEWKILFSSYYGIAISDSFIQCANDQLSLFFEQQCGIVLPVAGVCCYINTDLIKLNYKKGIVSSVNVEIGLVNGLLLAKICWKSVSGAIYTFSDENINCKDIYFWFEDLDPKKVIGIFKPSFSLFKYPYDSYIEECKKRFNISVSIEFIKCADFHLTPLFEKATGIKFTRKVSTGWASDVLRTYTKDKISRFQIMLWVGQNQNDVTICWRSKSGRIYDMADEDIDCDDLNFWFENLDPLTYHKQLFPKLNIPFKLKNLTYELEIQRLDIYLEMEMFLKPSFEKTKVSQLTDSIDNWLNLYNKKNMVDEERTEKYGSVNKWKHTVEENKLFYHFSWDTAGFEYLKAFLKYLSKLNVFEKIVVG